MCWACNSAPPGTLPRGTPCESPSGGLGACSSAHRSARLGEAAVLKAEEVSVGGQGTIPEPPCSPVHLLQAWGQFLVAQTCLHDARPETPRLLRSRSISNRPQCLRWHKVVALFKEIQPQSRHQWCRGMTRHGILGIKFVSRSK